MKPLVPIAFITIIGAVLFVHAVSRLILLTPPDGWLGFWAVLSMGLWILVLWWGFYHLLFQAVSIFTPTPVNITVDTAPVTPFVVLYMTCDDFSEHCARS